MNTQIPEESQASKAIKEYATQLLAAQERIKQLEDALYYIRESYSDQPNSIAFKTANEALSPNNKMKEDE